MGFMDKMRFWKKDDFLEEDPLKDSLGSDPFNTPKQEDPFLQPLDESQPHQEVNNNTPQDLSLNKPPLTPQEQMIKDQYERLRNPDLAQPTTQIKETDLILSKLDTIKAMVENLNQRLTIIEEYLKRERYR